MTIGQRWWLSVSNGTNPSLAHRHRAPHSWCSSYDATCMYFAKAAKASPARCPSILSPTLAPPLPPMQIRRRIQIWRFRLTTLRRRPVTLHEFHSATTAAYAARRFRRPLHPAELQQLACHAGFPLAAAVSLAACLEAAERCSQGAAELQQSLKRISLVGIPPWRFYFYLWWFTRWGHRNEHGRTPLLTALVCMHAKAPRRLLPGASRLARRGNRAAAERATQLHAAPAMPALWAPAYAKPGMQCAGGFAPPSHSCMQNTPALVPWVCRPACRSHLNTLELVRREWEHQEPQLIGGFDLSRSTAVAMLFRRPKVCLPSSLCPPQAQHALPRSAVRLASLLFHASLALNLLTCSRFQACLLSHPLQQSHPVAPASCLLPNPLSLPLQGTCMLRLGMEAGGLIVSVRPDNARLQGAAPDQLRCLFLPAIAAAARCPWHTSPPTPPPPQHITVTLSHTHTHTSTPTPAQHITAPPTPHPTAFKAFSAGIPPPQRSRAPWRATSARCLSPRWRAARTSWRPRPTCRRSSGGARGRSCISTCPTAPWRSTTGCW